MALRRGPACAQAAALALACGWLGALPAPALAAETQPVRLHYLRREPPRPPTLSNLERPPQDEGVAGFRLGVQDNTASGRFSGIAFSAGETLSESRDALLAAAREALADPRIAALVMDAPAADVLAVADLPEAKDRLILNAAAPDDALRGRDCRRNVLHTMPSRAMLTDALAQAAARRRWSRVFLLVGAAEGDVVLAEAMKASARKFGLRIVAERRVTETADLRRTAQAEMPLLTQGAEYDVVFVADEARDIAPYVAYNTWLPRPVAGSAGLRPLPWSGVIEQWGAVQFQNRFRTLSRREMLPRDYAAWLAARVLGEAATRTKSADPATLAAHVRSAKFELAAFKGRPVTFRPWDGQLRQPIHLVTADAVVAVAPLEGFLHRRTELDTLGSDQEESACRFG
jgi:ABC transporter substrate binding protein (PQQ-dependent alcohol dehydrogenase system)